MVTGGAAILSFSVLTDSAMEHYRGSFKNPAMILPLASSLAGTFLNGTDGISGSYRKNTTSLLTHAAAMVIGLMGLGFHVFNITKRPGGLNANNLFYAAPIGAPGALVIAGALGAAGHILSPQNTPSALRSWLNNGRILCAASTFGIIGSVAEAGLLHFRGAYHNPAMWLPVTLPVVAACALARDTITGTAHRSTFWLLGSTAVMGVMGSAFHSYGVARNMGGWRNWRQNLLAGPPIPAPPAFTGLAIAGIGALLLMRSHRRG